MFSIRQDRRSMGESLSRYRRAQKGGGTEGEQGGERRKGSEQPSGAAVEHPQSLAPVRVVSMDL